MSEDSLEISVIDEQIKQIKGVNSIQFLIIIPSIAYFTLVLLSTFDNGGKFLIPWVVVQIAYLYVFINLNNSVSVQDKLNSNLLNLFLVLSIIPLLPIITVSTIFAENDISGIMDHEITNGISRWYVFYFYFILGKLIMGIINFRLFKFYKNELVDY